MWIFMNNAMFSIVQDQFVEDGLVVRARVKGDIEKVFTGFKVKESEDRDYRFRTFVPKETVAAIMKKSILNIDYDNFKDSIAKEDRDRKMAYHEVWAAMLQLQDRLAGYPYKWWMNYRDYKTTKKPAKKTKTEKLDPFFKGNHLE